MRLHRARHPVLELRGVDVIGNDLVDDLAQQAAGADALPEEQIEMVRQMAQIQALSIRASLLRIQRRQIPGVLQ